MVDGKSASECNIKENNFVVLMVKKSPGATAAAPAANSNAPATTNSGASSPAPVQQPKEASPPPTKKEDPPKDDGGVKPMDTTEDGAGKDTVSSAESTLLTNQGQIESAVTQLTDMGFPRDQAIKALRAAFNNPNRAVEYLMSGNIPDVAPAPQNNQPRPPAAGGGNASAGGAGGTGGASGGGPVNLFEAADRTRQGGGAGAGEGEEGGEGGENIFEFLRHNPQFNALRFMVQQNPNLLQPILGQLGQANPELLQLITQHQAEFTQLLNEPVNEADLPQGMPGMPGAGGGGGGAVQIALTVEEKDAIDRLVGLGFSEQAALEAYLSCDKNEQLAANYLLENGMDFGEDEGGFQDDFDDGN